MSALKVRLARWHVLESSLVEIYDAEQPVARGVDWYEKLIKTEDSSPLRLLPETLGPPLDTVHPVTL